ncbi:unnamed protein product, partial [Iphiclides podalirius]
MSILRSLLKIKTSITVPNSTWLSLIPGVNSNSLHTSAICCAAVKKTAAAGGVLGLGKGKKKLSKLSTMEKKVLPVETDPEKLLKDDSEYPDWLWTLNTSGPPKIEDLDPSTKEYWLRVRAAGMKRNNRLKSMRKF